MKDYRQTELFPMEEELTLSVEATRVSRFPLPDIKKAKRIKDTSGRSILGSLENSVRITRLERTWADIFDSVWIPYSKTWTAKTTPLGALVLKQRVSVPPTAGNGSSGSQKEQEKFWTTPTAMNIGVRSEKAMRYRKAYRESIGRKTVPPGSLAEQVQYGEPTTDMKMYPTPRVSDTEGGIVKNVELNNGSFSRRNKQGVRWGVKLRDAVNHLDKMEQQMWPTPRVSSANGPSQREINEGNPKRRLETEVVVREEMWPTPRQRDWKDGTSVPPSRIKNPGLMALPQKVISENKAQQKQSEIKLHLNPTWVEALMGFPPGWTVLGNEESQE